MQGTVKFSITFPSGPMERPGVSLDTWIAKSTTGVGTFTLPDGSICTMTEIVGDATAHVQPLRGTGSVDPFTNTYEIVITPPTED
jgi:hypothetical protein